MNCLDLYQSKLISVDQALRCIQSNQEIVCALGACEPAILLSHLHKIKDRVENVSVVSAMLQGQYDFFMKPEMKGHFLLDSWFYTEAPRKAHPLETVSYVPLQLHQFSRRRIAYRLPDIFGIGLAHGSTRLLSLSLSTVHEKDFIEKPVWSSWK